MNNEPVAWDRGTWTVGETESQEFIESSDFNHDVRLYLTGDFEDDTQRLNYLKHIADRLNTHPVKEQLTDEEILDFINAFCLDMGDYWELTERNAIPMIRAILRKAQE